MTWYKVHHLSNIWLSEIPLNRYKLTINDLRSDHSSIKFQSSMKNLGHFCHFLERIGKKSSNLRHLKDIG